VKVEGKESKFQVEMGLLSRKNIVVPKRPTGQKKGTEENTKDTKLA